MYKQKESSLFFFLNLSQNRTSGEKSLKEAKGIIHYEDSQD